MDGNLTLGSKLKLLRSRDLWQLLVLASLSQANISKLRRLLDTVALEELPDWRERTGALVLRLSCEGQADVWEMFFFRHFLSERHS